MSQNPHPLCFMLHVAIFGAVLLGIFPLGLILEPSASRISRSHSKSFCCNLLFHATALNVFIYCQAILLSVILGTHISDTSIALRTLVHRCMCLQHNSFTKMIRPDLIEAECFQSQINSCHELLSNCYSRPFLRPCVFFASHYDQKQSGQKIDRKH